MQSRINTADNTVDQKRKIPLPFALFLSAAAAFLSGAAPYLFARFGIIEAFFFMLIFYGAAAACVSFVFYAAETPLVLLYALPAYGLAYLFTRSPFVAALSLLSLPLTLSHLICLSRKKDKAPTVAAMAGALAAVTLAVFYAVYIARYGSLDIGRLIIHAQNFLRTQYNTANQLYLQMTGAVAYSENVIEATVAMFITRLPAVYLLCCMAAAYLSVLCFSLLLRHAELYKTCFPEGYVFKASFPAAVVYLVFYFLSLFFSEDLYSVPGVVAGNITAMLTPLMAIIGVKATARWIKKSFAGSAGCLVFLLLPLLFLLQSGALLITIASAIGVISVIGGRISAALQKKK